MEVVLAQGTVAVGADIFDLRAPEQQDAAPGPPGNRHAQAPQADPAAVALVPHDEVKCAREEQETQHQYEIAQKEGNALPERGKQVLLRREDAGDQFQHAPPSHSRDG